MARGPFFLQAPVRSNLGQLNAPKVGTLQISMSRAQMQATLQSIRSQLLSKQGVQTKRIGGAFAFITLPLLILGVAGRVLSRPSTGLTDCRFGEERRPDR